MGLRSHASPGTGPLSAWKEKAPDRNADLGHVPSRASVNDIYDAIVVGGGPAGSATAAYLARAGHRVLLLERATFPRDKPCGEFYSPAVRPVLRDLHVWEEVVHHGIQRVPGAQIQGADGRRFSGVYAAAAVRHPEAREGGFSIERVHLDRLLFENAARAGAEALQGVAVRDIVRHPADALSTVRTSSGEFRARIVIGADGSRSRVARVLGAPRPIPHLQKIAIVAHYAQVPLDDGHPIEMHLARMGDGRTAVCGFGPQPDGAANVTFVVPLDQAREIAASGAAEYIGTLLPLFPDVAARVGGAILRRTTTCGTLGHASRRASGDGMLLVGDAATFLDPFTGEGVFFALRGAQIAARVADRALRLGATSARALRAYDVARRRELAPRYALCAVIQRIVHDAALMRYLSSRLERRPGLVDGLLGVIGDMDSPYRLLRPGFVAACLAP